MNNEPVAWLYERPSGAAKLSFVQEKILWKDTTETPLYTHPADESFDRTASHMAGENVSYPAKTLTDEEINQLWAESHEDGIAIQQGFTTQQHYFARAILRKAQEK